MTWRVGTSVRAPARQVALAADTTLRGAEGDPHRWYASTDRACFTLSAEPLGGTLPAGWYWLEGTLLREDGVSTLPCLFPRYASGADGDPHIQLPPPAAGGRVRALVLFKYDVEALRFCPMGASGYFRSLGFRLYRLSRGAALRRMLVPHWPAVGGVFGRTSGFLATALREGVSRAADRMYRDYRRSVIPDESDYAVWVSRYDTISAAQMELLRARAEGIGDSGPLISILVPAYETPEPLLRRCIESVLAQVYPRWELCIADDASRNPGVQRLALEYARRDSRIRFVRREVNGHISEASNTALEIARGEFVALLDHDDELRPHALLEVAEAVAANPDLGLVYSDEDKLDTSGRRFDPYFKPEFDWDLLRGQNYICHLTVLRTAVVRSVGGFRKGFEGSQDHDLVLRCAEKLSAEQIRHIPRVLYHWRAIPGSTALSRSAKDYASAAGARAVEEHLARCHPGARVEELSHGHFRVRWPLPEPVPRVSLVIPTRDAVDLLRTCVDSILGKTEYPDFELVIVDNGSSDPAALAYLRELENCEGVRVLRYDAPFNYSAINNWAVRQCTGDLIGLVNNDIEVLSTGWLREMASQAWRPGVGAVGAMLYYPDDTIQHAGVVLGVDGVAAHLYAGMPRGYPGHGGRARVAQTLSAVTGACLVVRRTIYEQVGGLDEKLQVAFNDIDFCLRLREAGYRTVWTPFAELYHHESASRGTEDTEEKQQRFAGEVDLMVRRWGEQLSLDPAYNPNLSLSSRCCELSVPPRLQPG